MALGDLAKGSIIPMSTERSLIVAVDGTAAMGPYWKTIVSDYLEKIVRSIRAPSFVLTMMIPLSYLLYDESSTNYSGKKFVICFVAEINVASIAISRVLNLTRWVLAQGFRGERGARTGMRLFRSTGTVCDDELAL